MVLQLPVYNICSLATCSDNTSKNFLLVEIEYYKAILHSKLHYPHRHDFYQILYVTHGTGSHTIDFVTYPINAPCVFFLSPGQVHEWQMSDDICGYLLSFNNGLFKTLFCNGFNLYNYPFFHSLNNSPLLPIDDSHLPALTALFLEMMDEQKRNERYRAEMLIYLLNNLLVRFSRLYYHHANIQQSPAQLLLVREFETLVDKHYATKHHPKDYAPLLNITPNHLNEVCKNTIGKTAGELIRERILLEAKRLLLFSNQSIAEVAYSLQFEDNAYFSRFFKKYTAQTPDSFRKTAAL